MDRDLMAELPPLDQRTMSRVIGCRAGERPTQLAVVDDTVRLDNQELHLRALRLATAVRDLGVARQAPVLHMLDNHADHAVVWTGLGLGGFISVPINTALLGDLLTHVINDSRAEVLVVDAAYLPRIAECADRLAHLRVVVVRGRAEPLTAPRLRVVDYAEFAAGDAAEFAPVDPWDIHSIMYTSGTTGVSKGACVGHAQTFTRAAIIDIRLPDGAPPVSMVTLPLFHVVGQCRGLYSALIYGGHAVIKRQFSASAFWLDVRTHRVTYTSLLGAMATFVARQPPTERDADHSLRKVIMAPTIPEVAGFATRFGVQVITSYGSTEVGSVTVGEARGSGCGWLHPEFEGRLVDEWDNEVAPGEPGELLLRSRLPWTMTTGYWQLPEATTETFRNLWFHTGDIFRRADDGELVFVDRNKDMIRRRGENISAAEVERAALRHADVLECAAVAVPSEDSEDELKLVVARQPGARVSAEELLRFLVGVLPYFAVPRYIEFRAELPKTSTNKTRKAALVGMEPGRTWDREAAGLSVRRDGLVERP